MSASCFELPSIFRGYATKKKKRKTLHTTTSPQRVNMKNKPVSVGWDFYIHEFTENHKQRRVAIFVNLFWFAIRQGAALVFVVVFYLFLACPLRARPHCLGLTHNIGASRSAFLCSTGGRDPPFAQCGHKKSLWIYLTINIAHHTRCRKPLNLVRLVVCYIVQCLHKGVFTPTLCRGGGRPPVILLQCF